MILRIRNSRTIKGVSATLALSIFFQLVAPTQALALTGGPAQPEFNSFTPIGVSDMVDLSSGDMSYNIPLMDVGGYPLNIAYSAGVGMDEEASWVGLGWNLSVGQINRNVRGLPDDFKGDEMTYENFLKDNITAGANFEVNPAIAGFEILDVSAGMAAVYNSYSGFSMSPSVGISLDLGKNASVGFNVKSGPDGLSVSPNLSIHAKSKTKSKRNNTLGLNAGVSYNSRQGLSSMSLNMSASTQKKAVMKDNVVKVAAGKERSMSLGSSIGFAEQLYTPSKRVGMETGSFTVNASLGTEVFTAEVDGSVTGYGTVMIVRPNEYDKSVRAYGYNHTEKALEEDVLDFNREKDGNFSVNSTNLPITNYTYDIYSVQGQGVSGMYRPYRNQIGYIYDAKIRDNSNSSSLGLEIGATQTAHVGVDIEVTNVSSHSGVWSDENDMISNLQEGGSTAFNYERVHHKNVGDLSVDRDFYENSEMFKRSGDYQPVRVPYSGEKYHRKADGKYLMKNESGIGESVVLDSDNPLKRTQRQARNQTIFNLSVKEVQSGIGYGPVATSEIELTDQALDHHTAEVQILRNDGARYVYGLPAYNLKKVEATFAVEDDSPDCANGLVDYSNKVSDMVSVEAWRNSFGPLSSHDQYFNRVTTPAYVHTHLLTSILSTDYSDMTGDGPSTDDFGSYTKFTYKDYGTINEEHGESANDQYNWRVPVQENMASFNEGLKTDPNDNQGNYVYGEKEMYLIDKIETKTHVAIFNYSKRKDAKGVVDENGGLAADQNSYKLCSISLYSIEEYDENNTDSNDQSINLSTPIKVVHFEYSYDLCQGIRNTVFDASNPEFDLDDCEISNNGGKLTLKKIYFTYRNSNMGRYMGYEFDYDESNPLSNPDYNLKGYDSWGNYLPNEDGCDNTDPLRAAEFNFTSQDKSIQDQRSSVWSLRSISLPSGGKINVQYESDSYSHVQDKEVNRMYRVVGASEGSVNSISSVSNSLFTADISNTARPNLLLELGGQSDFLNEYWDNQEALKKAFFNLLTDPIYFRFLMNTTSQGGANPTNNNSLDNNSHFDFVTGYLNYNQSESISVFSENNIWYLNLPVKLVTRDDGPLANVENIHPVSKATWNFARKYLSKYAYSNIPNGPSDDIQALVEELVSPQALSNLTEIFTGPNGALENKLVGRRFIEDKAWVRLKEFDGEKLGGGCRVKQVTMSDQWAEMNTSASNYITMNYGQKYHYGISDAPDSRTSGVATYEPIGNKENPFVQPVFSTTKHMLAPDEENYIEKPFGESFFPTPTVTYARVSVSNLDGGENPGFQVKKLHKTGHVVTEFYTSRDYPTIVDQTRIDAVEDESQLLDNILKLNVRKHYTASQGYVIHLNDMNGKQKAQRVYAEGQTSPISGVVYRYDNNGAVTLDNDSALGDTPSSLGRNKGRLNNRVKVINPDGSISTETIGVEVDVVNDLRENISKTKIGGVNTNLAAFIVGVFPGLVPIPLPDYSQSEDQFRAISTTKVINTFGLLKETIAYDAGAAVYTRNLAWDAQTGEVLVTETVDEYNDKYYTLNYPAHWAYQGMGQASMNIGSFGTFTSGGAGLINTTTDNLLFEGDELYLYSTSVSVLNPQKVWVTNISGNNISVIDEVGDPAIITPGNDAFKVIRSGHRNLQSAGIMNVTLMKNPLDLGHIQAGYLNTTNWLDYRIINAGAVDYSDDWPVDCECGINNGVSMNNPYRINAKGVWRTKSSRTYLTGRNHQDEVTPRHQGFFTSFSPMYKWDTDLAIPTWQQDFTNWTFVAEVTDYSPYGFELENMDALNRYSAAQYGYNNTFPVAVGANTKYDEMGFDGFEDSNFDGCPYSSHFSFGHHQAGDKVNSFVSSQDAHTGRYSMKILPGGKAVMKKKLSCVTPK